MLDFLDQSKNQIIKKRYKMKEPFQLILVFFALFLIQSSCLHTGQKKAIGDQQLFYQDSYNYFVTQSGNIVWTGALSLAWHELTDSIIKEEVTLNTENSLAEKIVENFNKCPFVKNDLSASDYYIKSGYGQKTITQINQQVKQKFPNKSFPDINVVLTGKDIISYAYLSKSFKFLTNFQNTNDFLFKNNSVKGFKAVNRDQKKQVSYFYYQGQTQFLIKIQTKKQAEGVYLLRTNQNSAKVVDIVNEVKKWENQPKSVISQRDYFQMPIIDFDYNREVKEIQNIHLSNKNFQDYEFRTVLEGLKLKIDETGVKVENEGVIVEKATAVMNRPDPKYFILDDTFWIILAQKEKSPYVCIKVNNPTQKQQL